MAEVEQLQSPADGFSTEEASEYILEGVEVRGVTEAGERVRPSPAHVSDHRQGTAVRMGEEALGQAGCEGPVGFASTFSTCEIVQLELGSPGAMACVVERDKAAEASLGGDLLG